MSVLAVIPARLGSTRLPRKPLRLLGGKPLVVRVHERVTTMALADRVVVATDSAEIGAAVAAAGGEFVMTRGDHPSGTDRVAEVAFSADFERYDVVLNVQGDEPFIRDDAVAGSISMVQRNGFDIGTAAVPADEAAFDDPTVVKIVCGDDGGALYFSRAPIPWVREAEDLSLRQRVAWRHLGVYACSRGALQRWTGLDVHPLEQLERLEQLRPLAAGLTIGVARLHAAVVDGGVDTEEDLARANARWNDSYAERL
ncbi:MAG: 3-deoxy-manno-octulosonate cytidylyltransferase [Gemmatimonadota bacterium]